MILGGYELVSLNDLMVDIWNKDNMFIIWAYWTLRQVFPDTKLLKALGDNFPFSKK